ncbi:GxxExxY protein [Methanocella sp. MCL-LM]|uniref:GxxExxY protein n=1 Tax=Methanocella sp. MCL-LM TaxID=3412035 RepID=UPI003C72719D
METSFVYLPIEDLNKISYIARGAAFHVYNNLRPGLLESIYTLCLVEELRENGLQTESEVHLPVIYKGKKLNKELKIDILVEKALILEVKSVEDFTPLHYAQTLTYLRLSGLKLGLLMNFNSTDMNKSIKRVIN